MYYKHACIENKISLKFDIFRYLSSPSYVSIFEDDENPAIEQGPLMSLGYLNCPRLCSPYCIKHYLLSNVRNLFSNFSFYSKIIAHFVVDNF